MKTRDQIRQERLANPEKRDKYLRSMTETSEQITKSLENDYELKHTCDDNPDEFCVRCSYGQQAAELADEGIGIEGIDF